MSSDRQLNATNFRRGTGMERKASRSARHSATRNINDKISNKTKWLENKQKRKHDRRGRNRDRDTKYSEPLIERDNASPSQNRKARRAFDAHIRTLGWENHVTATICANKNENTTDWWNVETRGTKRSIKDISEDPADTKTQLAPGEITRLIDGKELATKPTFVHSKSVHAFAPSTSSGGFSGFAPSKSSGGISLGAYRQHRIKDNFAFAGGAMTGPATSMNVSSTYNMSDDRVYTSATPTGIMVSIVNDEPTWWDEWSAINEFHSDEEEILL